MILENKRDQLVTKNIGAIFIYDFANSTTGSIEVVVVAELDHFLNNLSRILLILIIHQNGRMKSMLEQMMAKSLLRR